MATRTRIIYQSQALFCAETGATTVRHHTDGIDRVQSLNYGFEISRQDVNQFGSLSSLDRLIVEQPTVSLDFTYYPQTGKQERAIGFDVNGTKNSTSSSIQSIIRGADLGATVRQDVMNYYVYLSNAGTDAIDTDAAKDPTNCDGVIAIGNAFMTQYSVDGSVGDLLSASVSCEALNISFNNASTTQTTPSAAYAGVQVLPAQIDPENGNALGANLFVEVPDSGEGTDTISALRPGDIDMELDTTATGHGVGVNVDDIKVQSFTLTFNMSRTPIERLGSKFAFTREIDFPTTATLDVTAVMGDHTDTIATNRDSLKNVMDNDADCEQVRITCHKDKNTSNDGIQWILMGPRIDSHSWSSAIGDNQTVDMSFSTQIGSSGDLNHGIAINTL